MFFHFLVLVLKEDYLNVPPSLLTANPGEQPDQSGEEKQRTGKPDGQAYPDLPAGGGQYTLCSVCVGVCVCVCTCVYGCMRVCVVSNAWLYPSFHTC